MLTFRSLIVYLFLSLVAATDEVGKKFLAEKKAEAGVVALKSGLLYKEIVAGTGKTPTLNSPTECHYEGKLVDGTVFELGDFCDGSLFCDLEIERCVRERHV